MTSNDYSLQNVQKYSRKSYKETVAPTQSYIKHARDDIYDESKNERFTIGTPGCSCDIDPESELINILHRKCPIIALAQQQLQTLSEGTDGFLCDNKRCCRSIIDLLLNCKDVLWSQNTSKYGILVIFFIFLIGLILGAATCGVSYRKFNSPILTCIDNYFIPDTYTKIEDTYRSIF